MRGINYRQMLSRWDQVILRICDECTPHDVLGVVADHLEGVVVEKGRVGLTTVGERGAIDLLREAMARITPDR